MTKRKRILILLFVLIFLTVTVAGGYAWADRHARMADAALSRWEFDTAALHLEKAARIWWYRSAEVCILQARAARQAARFDEAEEYLRRCRGLGVSPEKLELEVELLHLVRGDRPALEHLMVRRVLQEHPDTVSILEVLAPLYLKSFRLHDARHCVKRWLELEPDRLQPWLISAQVFERLHATEDTLASYRKVVELSPENLPARLTLAGLLTEGHDPSEALAHFEHVRQRQGETLPVLIGIARCQRLLNQPEETRQLIDRVLSEHPRHGVALSERAYLALQAGSYQEAEDWFRRALAEVPAERAILFGYYQCLVRLNKQQEAEKVLARMTQIETDLKRMVEVTAAVAREPQRAAWRCEAGKILLRNGQEAEAMRWLESALEVEPNHAESHQLLAAYFDKAGNADRASQHRAQALAGGSTGESSPTGGPGPRSQVR